MSVKKRNVAIVGAAATTLIAAGCGPTLIARSQAPEQSSVAMQVVPEAQRKAPRTRDYINRRTLIDYAQYVRLRRKLATN